MIPFDEIDSRLEKLGKNRAWLAGETGRSEGSIRSALAPNAEPKHRSALLQKALTDAIEREASRQESSIVAAPSLHLPDRLTIECRPEERRLWQAASGGNLDEWIVDSLNAAADRQLGLDSPSAPTLQALPRAQGKEA